MNKKRTQILNAAIELFAQNGAWNTPTAKIAKYAGVANGTLFNYFSSKQILVDEVYIEIKKDLVKFILSTSPLGQVFESNLRLLWHSYIIWGMTKPLHYNLLLQLRNSEMLSEEAKIKADEIFQDIMGILEKGMSDKKIVSLPIEYLSELIMAQTDAAIDFAKLHKMEKTKLEKHIEKSFSIFWHGAKV